jgi:hypothetical protein
MKSPRHEPGGVLKLTLGPIRTCAGFSSFALAAPWQRSARILQLKMEVFAGQKENVGNEVH